MAKLRSNVTRSIFTFSDGTTRTMYGTMIKGMRKGLQRPTSVVVRLPQVHYSDIDKHHLNELLYSVLPNVLHARCSKHIIIEEGL